MSIPAGTSVVSGIASEYAASSTNIRRIVMKVDGKMVGMFEGDSQYSRVDYVVDNDGNKIGVVQPDNSGPIMGDNPRIGSIHVPAAELTADLMADAALMSAFEKVSAYIDSKVRADLVRRGIIQ